jgi:chorismate--pyruvate lyase
MRDRLPDSVRRWLLDPTSLTRRMQQRCAGRFRVRLSRQGWGRPMRDESRALDMEHRHYALLREVHLLCDEQPWVFAHSVIPAQTLTGRYRRLARLGERPLGAVLFSDKTLRRGSLEITCITPGQRLFNEATVLLDSAPEGIWGRRSVFFVDDHPLLVSEFFLPLIGEGCGRRTSP